MSTGEDGSDGDDDEEEEDDEGEAGEEEEDEEADGSGGKVAPQQPERFDPEREKALKEMQIANGIREADIRNPDKVTHVEMVLDEFCSMKGLRYFPNLKSVCLINQALTKMEGLENCVNLEKLQLNENLLEQIEGLGACASLKKLYIGTNAIKELGRSLEGLTKLEVLWIAENRLSSLAGLELAPNLTDLNASRNELPTILGSFGRNAKLRVVNVSDNQICSFRDIVELTRLPELTEANFSDPDWGENPICLLYNYYTYALYHLPSLTVLDRMKVPPDERQSAEAAFARKRLYYNMRAKLLRRHTADATREGRAIHEERVAGIRSDVEAASRDLKRIEGCMLVKENNPSASHRLESSVALLDRIVGGGEGSVEKDGKAAQLRLEQCQAELADQNLLFEEFCAALQRERERHGRSLQVELQSGGNVRLEPCAPDKAPWARQLEELVRARLRPAEFGPHGVTDIEVVEVTKVVNQSLRARFEDSLQRRGLDSNSGGKQLEYLFFVLDPRREVSDLRHVAEDGARGCGGTRYCPVPEEGSDQDEEDSKEIEAGDDGLFLTNSVSLAERARLDAFGNTPSGEALGRLIKSGLARHRASLAGGEGGGGGAHGLEDVRATFSGGGSSGSRAPPLCGGMLLVCSACLGDPRPDDPGSFDADADPDIRSVWRREPSRLAELDDTPTRDGAGAGAAAGVVPGGAPPRGAPAGGSGASGSGGAGAGAEGEGAPAAAAKGLGAPNFAVDALYRSRAGDTKQKVWRMPDPDLVLPEFLVEFNYVYSSEFISSRIEEKQPQTNGPFATLVRDFRFAAKVAAGAPEAADASSAPRSSALAMAASAASAAASAISAVVAGTGAPPARQVSAGGESAMSGAGGGEADEGGEHHELQQGQEVLDEEALLDSSNAIFGCVEPKVLAGVRVLDLHGRGIRRIDASALRPLASLQTLLLSFNCIASFGSLPECKSMTWLDLSFNYLEKVSSLAIAPSLTKLDVSWNSLGLSLEARDLEASLSDVFASLERDVPELEVLDMSGNPVTRSPWHRRVALAHLPRLRTLDGEDVAEGEALEAKRGLSKFEDQELTEAMLLENTFLFVGCSPSAPSSASSGAQRRRSPLSMSLSAGSEASGEILGPRASAALAAAGAAAAALASGQTSAARVPGLTKQNWRGLAEFLDLRDIGLSALTGFGVNLSGFKALRRMCLNGNRLTTLSALSCCSALEELSVENNLLPSLTGLGGLLQLHRIDAGSNRISDGLELKKLERLTQLSLEDNLIDSLDTFAHLSGLMELYLSSNLVEEMRSVLLLKQLPRLLVLELFGNELCVASDYRLYTIFHLRRLKVLDGIPILPEALREAEERFSGKITMELLEDKLGPAPSCYSFRSVDLSGQGLRELGNLLNDDIFPSLRELNIEGNPISDIRSLGPLSKLLVLKMSRTKVDLEKGMLSVEDNSGVASLPHLQVLELGSCGISDMSSFSGFPLQTLRILHLPGNDISKVDGLSHMEQLRELVLDKNKIKSVDEHGFAGLRSLRELRMDDNGLKSLGNFGPLPKLRALHLSLNRVAELAELEKLRCLRHVVVINLAQNPVARKPLYRAHLIHAVSSLRAIDGREVTDDERERVDQLVQGASGQPPPGAGIYVFTEAAGPGMGGPGVPGGGLLLGGGGGMGGGQSMAAATAAPPQMVAQHLSCGVSPMFGGGQEGVPQRGGHQDARPRGGGGGGGGSSHILMTGFGLGNEAPATSGAGGGNSGGSAAMRRRGSNTVAQGRQEYRSAVMPPPGSGR